MASVKDLTMYMKIEWDSKPTDYDKIGSGDGLYVKSCEPIKFDKLEKENNLWRVLLWTRHGCETAYLYGDDGEMQCNKCMIDFKRDSPESILEKWQLAAMKELKEQHNG